MPSRYAEMSDNEAIYGGNCVSAVASGFKWGTFVFLGSTVIADAIAFKYENKTLETVGGVCFAGTVICGILWFSFAQIPVGKSTNVTVKAKQTGIVREVPVHPSEGMG